MIYMISTTNNVDLLQVRHLVDAKEYLAKGAAIAPPGTTFNPFGRLSTVAGTADNVDCIDAIAVPYSAPPVLPQSGGLSYGVATVTGRKLDG